MTSSPSTPLNPLHPHPHHLEVTGVLPHCGSLTLSSGCCGSKNIQTKHRHEKRSGSSMMMRVRHIACPWLFCFFPPFSSLFGWKIFGSVRSAALALMRKDVLEMRILYEGVICDRVFYFFFFFFILSPSLLLSSYYCVLLRSFPWDHLPDNVGSTTQHLTLIFCWCSLWFSRWHSSLHALDNVVE